MIPLQGNQLLERYLNADPQKDSSLRIQQEYRHLFQWIHKIPQPENTIDQR
jgi:plasmid maintenance system killer protein